MRVDKPGRAPGPHRSRVGPFHADRTSGKKSRARGAEDIIVGLTGPNAAGKGEAALFLQARGFRYHSLSDVVREEATRRGLDHTRENLIRVGNDLRARSGPGVLAERIVERLGGQARVTGAGDKQPPAEAGVMIRPVRAIVDSIRSPSEVEVLRRAAGFVLVGVDAPMPLRYERAVRRGRIGDGATPAEFEKKEALENSADPMAQQLAAALRLADILVMNDGTLQDLHDRLAAALQLDV